MVQICPERNWHFIWFGFVFKHFLAKLLAPSQRKTNTGPPRALKVKINMLLLISYLKNSALLLSTFAVAAYNQLPFNEVLKCPNLLKIIKKIVTIMHKYHTVKSIKYVLLSILILVEFPFS